MRWVVISLSIHALLVVWLARHRGDEQLMPWHPPALPTFENVEAETIVELFDEPAVQGGGGGGALVRASHARSAPIRSRDAWEQVDLHIEAAGAPGDGGAGAGHGTGSGAGIGLGSGGGIRVATDVPAPPPPPAISRARPAQLVWPNRDEEVEDEANLFVAKVTVDAEGSVVGARMLAARSGAKAERAANAIWTFRYAPALDDEGHAITSTFEQSFQVR